MLWKHCQNEPWAEDKFTKAGSSRAQKLFSSAPVMYIFSFQGEIGFRKTKQLGGNTTAC